MKECVFCRIVQRKEEAQIIYENESTLAFFPDTPAIPGHTLVIPKEHIPDIWSLKLDVTPMLTKTVLKISHALKAALRPEGLNIINSSGAAASQTIFHLHVHLVPRWENDRMGNIWPPKEPVAQEVENRIAALVCEALGESVEFES
jgi:diadenosine tetraphosphate (Ap4A) HIT family hydrolase